MPDAVNQLLATEAALNKFGARGISVVEAEQTIWNRHVVVRNRRGSPERRQLDVRRLVIGESDASRVLTLVIEETIEPTIWLLITGWDSTPAERNIFGEIVMSSHPDPLPGDFDEELGNLDPADVQMVESSYDRHVSVQFTLDGDDAAALQRIADDQGERPGEVVRSLIRAASVKAA